MGIYYYAVDFVEKKYFTAPHMHTLKSPGIYHPQNPFPGMMVMMNIRGYHFQIHDDTSDDFPPEHDFQDVTDEVYEEYKSVFK